MRVSYKWPTTKLGDHIELFAGFPFKSQRFTSRVEDIPLVKGENVSQGFIEWQKSKRWPADEIDKYEEYKLRVGDVVLAMDRPWIEAGLKYAWIKSGDPVALLVQRVARLRSRENLDQTFLRYIVGSVAFASYIRIIVTGVNVPHISGQQIKDYQFQLPPIEIQKRVGQLLSAFDDLIENNTRRIQILEQMTQTIYREWFVNFRFPGHEKTKFVDSPMGKIPVGWEVREMQEIADVIDCLHSKKPQHDDSGTRLLLQLCNIGEGGIIDLSDKFQITEDVYQKWTTRIEVREGDCVVTNVGRVGAVAQIPKGLKAAIGRNMTAIRPGAVGPTYLIEYLLSPHMAKEVQVKKDAGSIMDSLNVKGIVKLLVPVAPRPLMDKYEKSSSPMRALIERLFEINAILRHIRDILLPKLISGDLDVSGIRIELQGSDS